MSLNSILNHPDFAGSGPAQTFKQTPLGFVDVGTRGGVHEIVYPAAGITAVLGFEPDVSEIAAIKARLDKDMPWARCDIEPIALGEKRGQATLHHFTASTNNSLLSANQDITRRYRMVKWEETGQSAIDLMSLDDVLFGARSQETFWGEVIKLDTQGTEYDILMGARRTLTERTVAVISEVEFFEVYAGQKLFTDVEQLLRGLGFSFYGFTSLHHRSCSQLNKKCEAGRERAFFADAVFFKDPLNHGGGIKAESSGANLASLHPPLSVRQLHALFVCALLAEYYDFALELALKTWATGEEAVRIDRLVRAVALRLASQSQQAALALGLRVLSEPENATIAVGQFVDRYRQSFDFSDTK